MMELKHGSLATFEGRYKKRTFWQWLIGKPKELQVFYMADIEKWDNKLNETQS